MQDAVGGATPGRLSLVQRAIGGKGASGFRGGSGGAATSELTAINPGGGDLALVVEATGGAGGNGGRGGIAGSAGAAHAATQAEGAAAISVEARAVGGAGAGPGASVSGDGGAATLGPVSARSTGGGIVTVTGEAIGGAGGTSRTGGGDGASALLDNAVQGDTSGSLTLVQRAIGGNAGSINFDFGAAGSAGVAGSAVSRLGKIARATQLSVTSYAAGGDSGDRSTTGHLDAADAEATAAFDRLALRISNGTNAILERIFEDAAAAAEFFGQNLLLSGLTSVTTSPGAFDLHFVLELTSDRTGGRFGTVFALGTVAIPEPATGTLMVLGLIVLVVYRRGAIRRAIY